MTERPWSTQPVTGAQHDAWMAEDAPPGWVMQDDGSWINDDGYIIHRHPRTLEEEAPLTVTYTLTFSSEQEVERAVSFCQPSKYPHPRCSLNCVYTIYWAAREMNQRSEYTEFMQGWSADVKAHPPRISS